MLINKLDELLKKNNKSAYWLIKQTGIRPNTIYSLVDKEAKEISFINLERICLALDCNSNDLFEIID